ncbi:hypothetical protein [Haloarcula sp. Atlit-7R]|uniref:hypothetical protein n=1 Tax=Haloarcula sp. Atlit-7R TaxID=2282125 RepID=UPI000EF16554|nr:hypothetical protein [Haloarcula sp. Atlit-7R]RLM94357.1 hypothetical protein D3D01_15965 [Haloarcula sp. Atlit-7R]
MSFENDKVRKHLLDFIEPEDKVLNVCAGETRLPVSDVDRNDLRDDVDAEYNLDARVLFDEIDETYDVVVYDPPFSLNQHTQTYGLEPELWPGYGEQIARGMESVLEEGGLAIQLGFHGTIDPADETALTPVSVSAFQQLGRMDDWCLTVAVKASEPTTCSNTKVENCVQPNTSSTNELVEGRGFNMEYTRVDSHLSRGKTAAKVLETLDEPAGKTLALIWGEEPSPFQSTLAQRESFVDGIVPYRGPADRIVSVRLGSGRNKRGIEIHPDDLTEAIPSLDYDNVILWPHSHGWNWNITRNGGPCGYIKAIKQQLDAALGSGTTVTTVGHTMTGMRDAWGYTHSGVHILDPSNDIRCTYISHFEKPQTGLGESQSANTPIDIGYRQTSAEPNWISVDTLTTWNRHPAYYISCPVCGAHGNHYCIEDNEQCGMHSERMEWFRENYRENETVRWYRHREFGEVKQEPTCEFESVATESGTTRCENNPDPGPETKTVSTTLEDYANG